MKNHTAHNTKVYLGHKRTARRLHHLVQNVTRRLWQRNFSLPQLLDHAVYVPELGDIITLTSDQFREYQRLPRGHSAQRDAFIDRFRGLQ